MSKPTKATPTPPSAKTTHASHPVHLIPGREGGKPSAAPPAKVHREPGQGLVKVADSDNDGK
jgi:hypothetical protein